MTSENDEKIKQVISILESRNVSHKIDELLNSYRYESTEIQYNDEKNLSDELFSDLKVREIKKQLNFKYKDKSLQILLTNLLYTEDNERFYDLIVLYKDICVLKDNVTEENDPYTTTYRTGSFTEYSLKIFKNGSWIEDLDYLTKEFKKNNDLSDSVNNNKRRQELSNNIDLDPID
jgi:hypothetical protein